jgi:hypothetical protein
LLLSLLICKILESLAGYAVNALNLEEKTEGKIEEEEISEKHYILRCVAENVPALKVPRQCPLVLLVNMWCRREIKTFGS